MIKRKYARSSCFFAAALLFSIMGQETAAADSFLNPARNAYSLNKTLDRPFLQSVPVPRVWQTDSSSEEFKRALSDAVLPETKEERQLWADEWQTELPDMQRDFQTITLDDQMSEKTDIADTLNEIMPIVVVANDIMVEDIEKMENGYDSYQISLSQKEIENLSKQLIDAHSFYNALEETAMTDVKLDALKKFFQEKERQETQISIKATETFFSDAVLDQAEKLFSFERQGSPGMRAVDETLWSLLVNDVLDLSTGTNTLMQDEPFFLEKKENSRRSASLLDSAEKTDQVQGDVFLREKQALLKRLPRVLTSGRIKGVR